MNRAEIEIKMQTERAMILGICNSLSSEDLLRGITPSGDDPTSLWSIRDHLIHLSGIERRFNTFVKRFLAGEKNPIDLVPGPDGKMLSREILQQMFWAPGEVSPEIKKIREMINPRLNKMNEEWVNEHRPKNFSQVIALGQQVRAETLALLAELTDDQLAATLPGSPWGDGTVGGLLATNGDHVRQHYAWLTKAGFDSHSQQAEV